MSAEPDEAKPQGMTLGQLLQRCEQDIRARQYDKARQLLTATRDGLLRTGVPQDHPALRRLRRALWRLAPYWWSSLAHGDITLRRCGAADADFVQRCYADTDFARRYNRQVPWRGDLATALDKAGTLPPLDTGTLAWVIHHQGRPIGLASLSSISAVNRKAEWSLGFVDAATIPGPAKLRAQLLLMHFSYFVAGLNKLYAYIYTDNPEALQSGTRLGFVEEGLLREHCYLPPGRFFDVHVIGLTRAQLLGSPGMLALARRWLGKDWSRLPA